MAVVKELIRTEENGTISFGDYEKNQKSKVVRVLVYIFAGSITTPYEPT